MKRWRAYLLLSTIGVAFNTVTAQPLPIFDAHIHYSHDAWQTLSPREAIAALKRAGVTRALVSSSPDDGTLKLLEVDSELVIPELRPYRNRGELGTWFGDDSIVEHVETRLKRGACAAPPCARKYVGIGEFHVNGEDADRPVVKRMVALARQYGIHLHAHSDEDAIHRLFKQDADARIVWAHAGFVREPERVAAMMEKYPRLSADLSFRYDIALDGKLDARWRDVLVKFADRFVVGTDTYTPSRWNDVSGHGDWVRSWVTQLPEAVAHKIAFENGERLFAKR